MASLINPGKIDITYPIAGQDNDTQGFRTNYQNIKNNFTVAASEITAIQSNVETLQGQIYNDNSVAAYLPTYTGNISAGNLNVTSVTYTNQEIINTTEVVTGNLTIGGIITGNLTTFTGSITGNILTVTGATTGLISWGQYVQGNGVADDTFITYQHTGTSGGNGTYYVSVSQSVSARPMYVHGVYVDSDIKLTEGHGIYSQDEHDPGLYNLVIGIKAEEATVHVGDINTNGMSLTNNQEYKVDSALNPGTYMAVAKVDTFDNVILGSGNGNTTQIRVGGDTTYGFNYGQKFFNGGEAHIPVGLRIGDNTNSSIFQAPLEVGSILHGAADNQSSPGGIAVPTYRGTGTVIANDEWGSYIYGSRYRGTINSPLPVKTNDWLMEFGSTAFDGTNNNGGGEMAFRVDGAVTGSVNPSRWELYVTPAGTNSQTLGLKVDSNLAVTAYGNITTTGNISSRTLTVTSALQFANLTNTQITAISTPARGMTVYNYNTGNIQVYNGTKWANITLS